MGIADRVMLREVAAVSRSLLAGLALCATIGLLLSLGLAYVLVRPIHELVTAAHRIREGDFSVRAHLRSDDEIGTLASRIQSDGRESRGGFAKKCAERKMHACRSWPAWYTPKRKKRKRLARELHDQLGQSLSHTLLTIESACATCKGINEHCCRVKEDIRGLIDEVRRLAWNARPSILDDYGLDHALHRLVEDTAKRVQFTLDYQCVSASDEARMPGVIEVTLYRIAQEALTNVLRHAGASHASVILMRQTAAVSLIVEDDGRGIPAEADAPNGRQSLGLVGMRERAALVGGAPRSRFRPWKRNYRPCQNPPRSGSCGK